MTNMMKNKRAVLALGAIVLVLVGLAGWQFVVSPQLAQGSSIKASIAQINTSIQLAEAKIKGECNKLTNIEAVLAQARNNQAKFPPTADVTTLFTQIRTAANSAGISTQNITEVQAPAPVIGNVNSVAEMGITITVAGKPTQVATFLGALEAMPRSFLVTNLAVTPGTSKNQVDITINGNAFIIQTESLQQVLTQVNRARLDLVRQCNLTNVPGAAAGAANSTNSTSPAGSAPAPATGGAPATTTTVPPTTTPTTPATGTTTPPAGQQPPTSTTPQTSATPGIG